MADIRNTFSKGLTTLNVKTANFLELNKIKTYITTLKTEITGLKTEIGDTIYASWSENGNISLEKVEEKLNLIQEKERLIEEQEAETVRLSEMEKHILGDGEGKGKSGAEAVLTCPGCGQVCDTPLKFCKKCGTKMN